MNPGDSIRTTNPIRSHRTGSFLPREGTFVRAIDNLGRTLLLINFGNAGEEYVFPDEILNETAGAYGDRGFAMLPASPGFHTATGEAYE